MLWTSRQELLLGFQCGVSEAVLLNHAPYCSCTSTTLARAYLLSCCITASDFYIDLKLVLEHQTELTAASPH